MFSWFRRRRSSTTLSRRRPSPNLNTSSHSAKGHSRNQSTETTASDFSTWSQDTTASDVSRGTVETTISAGYVCQSRRKASRNSKPSKSSSRASSPETQERPEPRSRSDTSLSARSFRVITRTPLQKKRSSVWFDILPVRRRRHPKEEIHFVRFEVYVGTVNLDSSRTVSGGQAAFTLEHGFRLPALSPSILHLPLPPTPIPTSTRGVSSPHRYGTECCTWRKFVDPKANRHNVLSLPSHLCDLRPQYLLEVGNNAMQPGSAGDRPVQHSRHDSNSSISSASSNCTSEPEASMRDLCPSVSDIEIGISVSLLRTSARIVAV
ncbi:hypothetical protein AC578_1172 [Pseudocercospora eumusae]|uniref:Uncharacterized protein n=1 Tax=Pseudocercospora eumusae TaxID=321146 RepID=A0A139HJV8_9PEZI|nr:hypothetical protein AC578_1172 [Pseudocercospora eumusae]